MNLRGSFWATRAAVDSEDARRAARRGARGGSAATNEREYPYEIAPLSEIADYYPPFNARAAIADRGGNLWILPNVSALSKSGELVYDVVNPKRGLVEYVRIPVGRSIIGFGKGGGARYTPRIAGDVNGDGVSNDRAYIIDPAASTDPGMASAMRTLLMSGTSRFVHARERTVDYLLTLIPDAKRVLTSKQKRKLPLQIANYLDERVLKFLRSSSSGDGSAVAR